MRHLTAFTLQTVSLASHTSLTEQRSSEEVKHRVVQVPIACKWQCHGSCMHSWLSCLQKRVTPTDAQRECAADSTAKLGRMPHMHATLRTQNTTHSRAASARPTDLMQTMARSPASIASPQPAGYPVTGAQRTLGFPHNATGGMHHDGAGVHTPKARGVRTRLSFHSEASPRRHSPGAVSAGVDMRRVSPRTDSPRVGGARSRSKVRASTGRHTKGKNGVLSSCACKIRYRAVALTNAG